MMDRIYHNVFTFALWAQCDEVDYEKIPKGDNERVWCLHYFPEILAVLNEEDGKNVWYIVKKEVYMAEGRQPDDGGIGFWWDEDCCRTERNGPHFEEALIDFMQMVHILQG